MCVDKTKPVLQNEQPLVSVIVPVYNVELYLGQCVESMLGQTYSNLQVILVDDGSTDGSGAMCDEFARSDARVCVFHTLNGGMSSARNCGLQHATGEFVLMVDSDDWMELNAVERLVSTAVRTGSDIVCAGLSMEWVDKTENQRGLAVREETFYGNASLYALIHDKKINNIACAKLFKRALFCGVCYPVGRAYEDVATTWRLVEAAGAVTVLPEVLFHYRMRETSISHAFTVKNIVEYWLVYKERLEDLGNKYVDLRGDMIGGCAIAITSAWRRLHPISATDKQKYASHIKDMQYFSRRYRREVLAGHESLMVKFVFLLCQFANPVVWAALYGMGEFYDRVKVHERGKMYP